MGERILILDDEAAILDILNQYLSGEGFTCVLATTAHECFEYMALDSFSIAFTDLGLPDMKGLDVVQRIRTEWPETGIIVITGLSEVTAAVDAMRAGADDYLVKPLNFSAISMSISKVLEKRALLVENRRYQENLEVRVREATEDLERTNRELRATKEYLESLLHSTVDAIITADREGKVSFANEGAVQLLGYARNELEGMPVIRLLASGEDEVQFLLRAVRDEKPLQNHETEVKRRDGRSTPVNMSVSLVRNSERRVVAWLAICKDITEQKRLERELKEMSVKDSLTGLYNHRNFYDRLEGEIERARRQRHPLSLLLLDLDQFKYYNDRHGHFAGDTVLRGVGDVIRECTRGHVDLGFRYGGDEFTVILPEADQRQAEHIAERIRCTFEARNFGNITMSIGVMQYEADCPIRKFIQSVDAMMYEAKRSGGNQVRVFDAETCMRVLRAFQPPGAPPEPEKS